MRKKVVVIGGGHGQSLICRAIKTIEELDISAIVTVADDGGSTGRLRRQFHIPAMGDIRNVLVSLAENETVMSDLMNYRFEDPDDKQDGILGHNLGNLILTALTQQSGSFLEAIQTAGEILNVRGKIIPATTQVITLFAKMEDGVIVKGEANIPTMSNHIQEVFYDCEVEADPDAVKAIHEADLILYGIGSVYTSILPNVIIPHIREALNESSAQKVYMCNAMTQPGETNGFSVEDHVRALEHHGVKVDAVLVANDEIPAEIAERYLQTSSSPVQVSEGHHNYRIITRRLLRFDNGLIRHDVNKVREAIKNLLKEEN